MTHSKKHLGQNFLKSEAALRKIVEVGEVGSSDVVLEIGPGRGALTARLLEKAGVVVAVEKDDELIEFLNEKFETEIKNKKLILINADVLEFNINGAILTFGDGLGIVSEDLSKSLKLRSYKIIANIPYNITGAILKKFLTEEKQPERMILMLQQEVAQRIVARDNKESILSISVKAYGTPKMEMKVPARYFSPAPKVDSAVISIKNISRGVFRKSGIQEELFWQIVKKGFAHKRKKLSSNIKSMLKNADNSVLANLGNKRAEDLTLAEWILLAKA
ncbi:MAG: 16S rRNA (adenine(1518)-N(6)/adenine(1519)-N(6))-dimethyltransferase RsmA [Candidatus Paceibacterota bacterium]|jgi:16S rRNA (adenine1518-N6/adenine1519-N6)-dimethyltransferase